MLRIIRELARYPLTIARLEAELAALKAGQTRYIVEAEDLLNKLVAMEARWRARSYRAEQRETLQDAPGRTNGHPAGLSPLDRELLRRKGF